jgi:hypothetical protein
MEEELEDDLMSIDTNVHLTPLLPISGSSHHRYLVLNNVSKKNNIRDICSTALANNFSLLYIGNLEINGK